MESIYYAVRIIALLWVLMVAFIAMFGMNQNLKADRASGLGLAITISSVLPIIKQTISSGASALGAFSWGFPFVSYLGFLLFFLGIIMNWNGILTLNKQWSGMVVIKNDHKLIDSGIYTCIRHPIYAAILLEILGLGLALSNWVSILLLIVPNLAALVYRIYVEEKALIEHFGDVYTDYVRKTKRLIPGIL